MVITFVSPAPQNTVYAPDAFEGVLGHLIKVTMPNGQVRVGITRKAIVAEDGRSVEMAIEVVL